MRFASMLLMALIGFRDRNVATRLKMLAQTPAGLSGDPGLKVTDVYLFKAPSGGIPAKSGTTLGKATCDAYYLSFDGTDADLAVLQDSGSTTITATVFNMGSEAVAADAFVQAMRCNGLYLANWEDC